MARRLQTFGGLLPRAFRQVLASGMMLCVLVLAPAVPGAAQEEDGLYTIEDVKVDVTAENAAKAREDALVQAQRKAFSRLTQRLLSRPELEDLPVPDSEEIAVMVRNFEITDEQLSSVRYLATLTIRFKPEAVRGWLARAGLRFSDVESKPVVILPFYQVGAKSLLWEDPNPWYEAWARSHLEEGLVPIVVPIGDVLDLNDVPGAEVLSGRAGNLDRMAKRYGAGDVVMAIAMAGRSQADPEAGMNIYLYEQGTGGVEHLGTVSVAPKPGRTKEELFARGVDKTVQYLRRDWKGQTATSASSSAHINAVTEFADLESWVSLRSKLKDAGPIARVEISSLTPHRARLKVHFRGTTEQLRLALRQQDVTLGPPIVDVNALGRTRAAQEAVYQLYTEGNQ